MHAFLCKSQSIFFLAVIQRLNLPIRDLLKKYFFYDMFYWIFFFIFLHYFFSITLATYWFQANIFFSQSLFNTCTPKAKIERKCYRSRTLSLTDWYVWSEIKTVKKKYKPTELLLNCVKERIKIGKKFRLFERVCIYAIWI